MAKKMRKDLKKVKSEGYQLNNADWKIEIEEEEESKERDVILNR